jgi:hypothetical protein
MLAPPTPLNPSPSPGSPLPHLFSVPSAISVLRKTPAKSATDPSASQLAPALFNLQLSTVNSPSSKSHRITFFADPHHLTLIESHSYKKRGRGVGIPAVHPTQTVPHFSTASKHPAHTNARNLFPFQSLTSRFSGYPGWGTPSANKDTALLFRPESLTFDCQLSTVDCLLLPCPPHSGAIHA